MGPWATPYQNVPAPKTRITLQPITRPSVIKVSLGAPPLPLPTNGPLLLLLNWQMVAATLLTIALTPMMLPVVSGSLRPLWLRPPLLSLPHKPPPIPPISLCFCPHSLLHFLLLPLLPTWPSWPTLNMLQSNSAPPCCRILGLTAFNSLLQYVNWLVWEVCSVN